MENRRLKLNTKKQNIENSKKHRAIWVIKEQDSQSEIRRGVERREISF